MILYDRCLQTLTLPASPYRPLCLDIEQAFSPRSIAFDCTKPNSRARAHATSTASLTLEVETLSRPRSIATLAVKGSFVQPTLTRDHISLAVRGWRLTPLLLATSTKSIVNGLLGCLCLHVGVTTTSSSSRPYAITKGSHHHPVRVLPTVSDKFLDLSPPSKRLLSAECQPLSDFVGERLMTRLRCLHRESQRSADITLFPTPTRLELGLFRHP